MYNSEELNTQHVVLQRIDETYTNACIYGVNANNVKLYSCVLPPLNFYQWNDLDLRVFRLFMKQQLPVDQSEEPSSHISTDIINADPMQSASVIPSMNFLLLIFIRYLQLVHFIPWFSPLSIADGPIETSKHTGTNTLLQDTKKRRKKNRKKQLLQPGLCGLTNIGNTCFMNSAIQCLSNIPQLTKWAIKQQSSEHQRTVTQAYTSLIQSMWSGDHSCVIPQTIKQRVSQHAPIFSDFAQKDSHEFMNSLLNALHSEFEENRSSEEQSSIVTDLFHIRTESGVTCLHCGTYDPIEETTYCLPLPLGDEPKVSLDTLLNDFVKEEQLDGQYYCSNCQELRLAKQKTSLCHPLPPVIIVQLKRFTFDETIDKLDTFVDYPIVNWKVNDNDDSLYDLIGVSMHVGNLKGGHYTTYARLNASDQWYHFNDSFFRPINDTNCLVNRNAYVLIYLKKN